MALKKCRECGEQISSKAKNCPNCGAPLSQMGRGCIGCVGIVCVFFILILAMGRCTADSGSTRVVFPDDPPASAAPAATAPSSSNQTATPATTPPSASAADSKPQASIPAPTATPAPGTTPKLSPKDAIGAAFPNSIPKPLPEATSSDEPDWKARHQYWVGRVANSFVPPKVGSKGRIVLANGLVQQGVLKELSEDEIKFQIDDKVTIGYKREQLSPKSRAIFFKHDYIAYQAEEMVKLEQRNYQNKIEQERRDREKKEKELAEWARKNELKVRIKHSDLLLLSSFWRKESGFAIMEGQVKNISGHTMHNVMVVVSFYTNDGRFITSDSTLITYNPILAEQTSPFKSLTPFNPAMDSASVDFSYILGGGKIPTISQKEIDDFNKKK